MPSVSQIEDNRGMDKKDKQLFFIASSLGDLRDFPDEVGRVMGFALYEAQRGAKHPAAKPLKGFGGASVLEICRNYDGDTYRGIYTVRFTDVVYVLHVFQKKSKHGARTPQADIDLVRKRLREAEEDYAQRPLEAKR